MKFFKSRKNKALEAFNSDLERLKDDRNHKSSWTDGFSENVRIYIGEKSPLYEGAKKISFWNVAGKRETAPYEAEQYVRQAIEKININGVTARLDIYNKLSSIEQWKVMSAIPAIITVVYWIGFYFGYQSVRKSKDDLILSRIDTLTTTIEGIQNNFTISYGDDLRTVTRVTSKLDSTLNSVLYRLNTISNTSVKPDTLRTGKFLGVGSQDN